MSPHRSLALASFALLSAAASTLAAPNADPSLHTETSGICTWNITCAGVPAHIRWSPDGGSCFADAVPDMPFVVVLRGHGFDYKDYDYLQDHLARNGMVSASLDVMATDAVPDAADFQAVADEAQGFLDSACFETNFLDHFPTAEPVDFAESAIIGHSRGGEIARYLASNLAAHATIDVEAVMALAPTRFTSKVINATNTSAYLLLYGTADHDPEPNSVFAAHDLAGQQEISTPAAFDIDRGMKLIATGTHFDFSDPAPFAPDHQQDATKGWANALLRGWLRADWQFYNEFVRENGVPGSLPDTGAQSQFSTRIARSVIDNFEDLTVTPNTLGGPVVSGSMTSISTLDVGGLATTLHDGRMLRVQPSANNAFVGWSIPVSERDFSDHLVLSLRIGQLTGAGAVTARIGVRNGGITTWVDVDDFGGIPQPQDICEDGVVVCTDFAEQGTVRTMRIPVSEFGGVDDVDMVWVQFLTGAVGDQVLIDNLEFAEAWTLAIP